VAELNKKKRILHLAHEMGVGGTQQVIRQLISHLDQEEFECSVACIDGYVGMLGEQLQADGVPIHVFDRKPGFDRALIRDIKALLVEQSFDLIHCHQYTPYTYGVLAAMFLDVKVVFTEHGRFYPDTYSWKRRLLNPLLQRRTNAIVAISAATADALKKYEWFSRGAVEVIYNGTDIGGATDCREAVRAEDACLWDHCAV
jgi:glycosyltransferase involved in cell wall biosynthesis